MGVKYQDYPEGWVNGRYVGKKMFPNGTITQDALGEMKKDDDGEVILDESGCPCNVEDGYSNIRETERMGTITPDVMAYEDFSIFDESKQSQNYTKVAIKAGDVMGEDGKTIVLTEHNTPKHDIPDVSTTGVDDE